MNRQRTAVAQDAKRSRPRTTLEWYDSRDRDILSDLNRFRGRAIGRRLKELMIMGVEAERLGMRATDEGGVWVAKLPGGWAAGTPVGPVPQGAASAEVPPSPADADAPPVLDEAHQKGLDDLFASFDGG